jgi:hypothetical protein
MQWTPTAFADARAGYERAIALDPAYGAPYAGLAEIFHILASGRGAEAQAHRERIRQAAERAMALDAELGEAQAWLGVLATCYDYDWKEAARRFARATAHEARLRHWNGYFHLRLIGRADEAVAEHEIALREDPLSVISRVGYIMSLMSAGRRADASVESRRLITMAPGFPAAYVLLAFDLPGASLDEALDFAERGYAASRGTPGSSPVGQTGLLAGLLRRKGDARADTLMQSVEDATVYGNAVDQALFRLAQDDTEAAIPWIERTLDERHPFGMMILIGGPYGERIRASSGWPAIARKINFPER